MWCRSGREYFSDFPDCNNKSHSEILFLKETNEQIAVWEGEKLTKEKAFETSGIKTVYWLNQFESIFRQLVVESNQVYLNSNEHLRTNNVMQTREIGLQKNLRLIFPIISLKDLPQ